MTTSHEAEGPAQFVLSEEHQDLQSSVRRFLDRYSTEEDVRRLMDTDEGYDPEVWARMADQLGLQSLSIPEQFGGAGFGAIEIAIVMEEMGRSLLCSPFFGSAVMATDLLLASGDTIVQQELLPGLADGTRIATVALLERSGRWDEEAVEATAMTGDDGWVLSGQKHFVLDGLVANTFLVVARTPAGVTLFEVAAGARGMSLSGVNTMDQTRKQATLLLENTPARLVGGEGSGWAAVREMLDRAAAALAAEQVGGAQRVLDMSVAYAKERVQFGRPIGSFQAIKHKCANLLVEVVSARSAAQYAAWAAATQSEDLSMAASIAKAYCSTAYLHTAAESIQIHGGIAFTWEHPAHLYLKRAKASEIFLGSPLLHRTHLADQLGI